MNEIIAEKKLLYSVKGSKAKNEFSITISNPFNVKQDTVNFPIGTGVSGCRIEVSGLNVKHHDVYGVDSVQALNIATDLEDFIKRLQENYNIYWPCGDPYFDDENKN